MVIVRESPRAQLSPSKNNTQWPPRSPLQVLLSSPSGRRKWMAHAGRGGARSPSPSPLRRPMQQTPPTSDEIAQGEMGDEGQSGEEDAETLQQELELELREIEVRKKLARLKKKNSKKENHSAGAVGGKETSVRSASQPPRLRHETVQVAVQVAVSPAKTRTLPQPHEQLSPSRKRLGLTAAPKAQHVSLKRARDGTRLPSSSSQLQSKSHQDLQEAVRPMSFSAKLATSKAQMEASRAKQERLETSRSTGFTSRKSALADLQPAKRVLEKPTIRDSSVTRPSSAGILQGNPTRDRQVTDTNRPAQQQADNDNNDDYDVSPSQFDPFSSLHLSKRHMPHSGVARALEDTQIYPLPRLLKEVCAPSYEPPDNCGDFVVLAILASKSSPFDQKTTIHSASADLAAAPPDNDAPLTVGPPPPRNKFMVLHLTDLQWEIDCFLFGTGFDRFWKLTPGTLLAILNPGIMPPKPGQHHSGRFSLKLASCEDRILEIGVARDLGYCVSVRKDGQRCEDWVDKRKTEVCEFHVALLVDRQRKHRMEVNSMFRGNSAVDSAQKRGLTRTEKNGAKDGKSRKKAANGSCHGEYGQLYSVKTGLAGASAAALMDDDDIDALHGLSRAEASRKRIAAAQRERDLRLRLSKVGNGVGAAYLRADHEGHGLGDGRAATATGGGDGGGEEETKPGGMFDKPKAAKLGLLGNVASQAHLSPAKDRKRHFGLGAVSAAGGVEAMGWGGAGKWGLLTPGARSDGGAASATPTTAAGKNGTVPARLLERSMKGRQKKRLEVVDDQVGETTERERGGSRSRSPTKKRARFRLAEKGIREPGRESLGVLQLDDVGGGGGGSEEAAEDVEDDDLEIV